MALHDYQCPACGAVATDQYRPIALRASSLLPVCPCAGVLMVWVPQLGAMDAGGSFTAFETQVLQRDGTHRTERIDSLHKLRTIERDTEQAYRNGEGQPMRFRMWSQDRSNGEVNSFGPDPSVAARRELESAGALLTASKGAAVVAEHGAAD